MSRESQPQSPSMFRIDVAADAPQTAADAKLTLVLNKILQQQERQTQLLAEIAENMAATHRQRANELGQWKQANPHLARACREAAETLSRVQTRFLHNITDEIQMHEESLVDGDFMLNEFVDRFGPRLAHLNGVLQVLSQLSSVPSSTTS